MQKKRLIFLVILLLTLQEKAFAVKDIKETDSSVKSIKPIFITAEKFAITEDMTSTEAINLAEIQRKSSKQVSEITKTLPNVEAAGSPRSSGFEFKIRGMDDSKIITKIDGSRTNFRSEYKGRNFISPFMLSNISVTRGSSSAMDGPSIAGSVNLKTKDIQDIALDPDAKRGAELFSSYGTNGNYQNYAGSTFVRDGGYYVVGMFDFSRNNNFSLPGKTKSSSVGPEIFTDILEYSNGRRNNGIIKFGKDFAGGSIKFSGSFFNEKGETTSNPFRFITSYRGKPVEKELTSKRMQGDLDLENISIKLFYDKIDIEESLIDKQQQRTDITQFASYGANIYGKFKTERESFENILFYGGEITREDQDGIRPGDGRSNLIPKGHANNYSLYFEDSIKKGNFKLLFGARQEFYELKVNDKSKTGSSRPLGKIAASYELWNFFSPFIRYSDGFRAPLIKETFASGQILDKAGFNLNLIPNHDLKPEYSRNYEAGFKIFSEGLIEELSQTSFNFTYFIQDVKDFVIQEPISGHPSFEVQYINLNKVRFNGIEAEAKYSSPKYLFSIAVSTLKAREVRDGNNLLQIPPAKLVIKAARKFENGLSIGFENISAASVGKDSFRRYENIPGRTRPTSNSGDFLLSEETAGYSIFNFNAEYVKKTNKFESIFGITLENAFNISYKEQASYIPGLGRNLNIYFKISF